MEIIKTAGIIVFQGNTVLLVRHIGASHLENTYGIPAGQIRADETSVQTALRKFTAETGLTTSEKFLTKLHKQYFAEIERKDGIKNFSLDVYLCKKFEGNITPSEQEKPEWVNLAKLDNIKLLPNMKEITMDAVNLAARP